MDMMTRAIIKTAEEDFGNALARLANKLLDDRYKNTVPKRQHQDVVEALKQCASILEDILPVLPPDKRRETEVYLNALALTLAEQK
jgi:hypothetical protein